MTVKKDDVTPLKPEEEYIVKYKNNKNARTATAIPIGKGKYTEGATTTFKITPASIDKATVTIEPSA